MTYGKFNDKITIVREYRGIAQLVEQRSPKPRAEGSSPSAPAKMKAHLLMCFLFYKKQKESKATVKKTVRWTVFRESVDASFLSYLCFISVVGTFAKLIVFCPCQSKNGLNDMFKPFFDAVLCSKHGLIFPFWCLFKASKCPTCANNSKDSVCYIIKISSI